MSNDIQKALDALNNTLTSLVRQDGKTGVVYLASRDIEAGEKVERLANVTGSLSSSVKAVNAEMTTHFAESNARLDQVVSANNTLAANIGGQTKVLEQLVQTATTLAENVATESKATRELISSEFKAITVENGGVRSVKATLDEATQAQLKQTAEQAAAAARWATEERKISIEEIDRLQSSAALKEHLEAVAKADPSAARKAMNEVQAWTPGTNKGTLAVYAALGALGAAGTYIGYRRGASSRDAEVTDLRLQLDEMSGAGDSPKVVNF